MGKYFVRKSQKFRVDKDRFFVTKILNGMNLEWVKCNVKDIRGTDSICMAVVFHKPYSAF